MILNAVFKTAGKLNSEVFHCRVCKKRKTKFFRNLIFLEETSFILVARKKDSTPEVEKLRNSKRFEKFVALRN